MTSDKDQGSAADADVDEQPVEEVVASTDDGEDIQESEEDLAVELAKAQTTIKDYWDQIMRLNAEIENNRKRAQRDVENAHKYAVSGFVESFLPVVDSMELGLSATDGENANMDSIKEGMRMTMELFIQTMEKNGVVAVDPVGEKFNPEFHQAMSMQENEEAEPNTVIAVMQKGYVLNERLVRPAMVVVSK